MKPFLFLALAALAVLIVQRAFFSFAAQRIGAYADTAPAFDIRRHLAGRLVSEGVIFGPDGGMASRFVATMEGSWEGDRGTLSESFRYQNGAVQERRWTLTFAPDGGFTATAPDILGTGRGEQAGAVAHLSYSLRLPEAAGGHVLDVTDWLYLTENGTIMNRSEMRKFGVKVAELIAAIRPAP